MTDEKCRVFWLPRLQTDMKKITHVSEAFSLILKIKCKQNIRIIFKTTSEEMRSSATQLVCRTEDDGGKKKPHSVNVHSVWVNSHKYA